MKIKSIPPNRVINLTLVFACLFGVFLRFSKLGDTPLQFDEAVNWHIVNSTQSSSTTHYNPEHFHGPLFFKLLNKTNFDTEVSLRILGVSLGIILILLGATFLYFENNLTTGLIAATFLALDPLLIFYNRVAIHENLFTLLSLLMTISFWIYCRTLSKIQIILAGITFGLLILTKETAVISLFSVIFALLIVSYSTNFLKRKLKLILSDIIIFLIASYLTTVILFADFREPINLITGILSWSKKGYNDMTQYQPWWFFVGLLIFTSPLALIAIFAVNIKDQLSKYLLIQGIVALIFYSVIPYKTPWLAASFIPLLYLSLAVYLKNSKFIYIVILILVLTCTTSYSTNYLHQNDSNQDVRIFAEDLNSRP